MPLLPAEPSLEECPSLTGSSQTAWAPYWDLSSLCLGQKGLPQEVYGRSIL